MRMMSPFPQWQPAFVELLKQHEKFISRWDLSRECRDDELDVLRGIKVMFRFPPRRDCWKALCAICRAFCPRLAFHPERFRSTFMQRRDLKRKVSG